MTRRNGTPLPGKLARTPVHLPTVDGKPIGLFNTREEARMVACRAALQQGGEPGTMLVFIAKEAK